MSESEANNYCARALCDHRFSLMYIYIRFYLRVF